MEDNLDLLHVSSAWVCVSNHAISVEVETFFLFEGSQKSRGGQVALPSSGSVEADSPHLHQTQLYFGRALKADPGGR